MSKTEAIIKQFYPDAKVKELDCFNINKVKRMMKEIASIAFDAGMEWRNSKFSAIRRCDTKGQFISKLFDNEVDKSV